MKIKILLLTVVIAGGMLFSCQKNSQDLVNTSETEAAVKDSIVHELVGSNNNKVYILEKDGQYFLAEDIVITQQQFNFIKANLSGKSTSDRSAIVQQFSRTWPNGIVYYTINPNIPNSTAINAAIEHYHTNTNLRFIPRTNQSNYVEFVYPSTPVNNSPIGIIGGRQVINIYNYNHMGIVTHEIGHTVGLFHEHMRTDRDDYVNIYFSNIQNGTNNINFKTFDEFGLPGLNIGSFDFNSVMMYGPFDFAINWFQPAMTRKNGTLWVAQRVGLSTGDIEGLNQLYL